MRSSSQASKLRVRWADNGARSDKSVGDCVSVMLDDLQAFDDSLWLHGPLPCDADSLLNHLGKIKNFRETSKQLEDVVVKIKEEDRAVLRKGRVRSASYSPTRSVGALSTRLSNLVKLVNDRERRVEEALGKVAKLTCAFDNIREKLEDTESTLNSINRDNMTEDGFVRLQSELDICFTGIEGARLLAGKTKMSAHLKLQFEDLQSQWSALVQKASCLNSSIKSRYLALTMRQVLPNLLETLVDVDSKLSESQPLTFDDQQIVNFDIFQRQTVLPVLETAKNAIKRHEEIGIDKGNYLVLGEFVDSIEKKLKRQRSRLELVRKFQRLDGEMSVWFDGAEQRLSYCNNDASKQKLSTFFQQLATLNELTCDIRQAASKLEKILEIGTDLESSLIAKSEALDIRKRLTVVHTRWQQLRDKTAVKTSQLSIVNKPAFLIFNQMKELDDWIDRTSEKVASCDWALAPEANSSTVKPLLNRLLLTKSYVSSKKKWLDDFLAKAQLLENESCADDTDRQEVRRLVDRTIERWCQLSASITTQLCQLEMAIARIEKPVAVKSELSAIRQKRYSSMSDSDLAIIGEPSSTQAISKRFEKLTAQLNNWFDTLKVEELGDVTALSEKNLRNELASAKSIASSIVEHQNVYDEAIVLGKRIVRENNCTFEGLLPVTRTMVKIQRQWRRVVNDNSVKVQTLEHALTQASLSEKAAQYLPLWTDATLAKIRDASTDDLKTQLSDQVKMEKELFGFYSDLPERYRKHIEKDWKNVYSQINRRHHHLHSKVQQRQQEKLGKSFNFDEWRRRYSSWLSDRKLRLLDAFRQLDKDRDGWVSRSDFVGGMLKSMFETNQVELKMVVIEIFENKQTINFKEFSQKIHKKASFNTTAWH